MQKVVTSGSVLRSLFAQKAWANGDLITHGSYHRGAAGQVLRGAGIAPPRDLYTRYLHLSEPSRRG